MADNRIHARVRTEIGCTLWTEDGEERGIVMDLSHGGALVQARRGAMKKGDALEMEIERGTADTIAVMIEILREEPLETTSTYATRFSLIEPKQATDLAAMIDALLGLPSGTKIHRRVELQCATADDLTALLANIKAGQISLQCGTALSLTEHVNIAVRMSASHEPVLLQGTVSHVRTVEENVFHVGLRFSPLSKEQQDSLSFYAKLLGVPGH